MADEVQLRWHKQTSQGRISKLGEFKNVRRVIRNNDHQIDVAVLMGFSRGLRPEEVDFQRVQGCNEALDDLLE
jgi:hypothetical protein